MLDRARRGLGSALALALAAHAPPATAATFDETGTLRFDPGAAATIDFEADLVVEEGGPSLTLPDEGALSGGRVLSLGSFGSIDVPVALPATATRYRVSAWIRGGEANLGVEVRYADNAHPGTDEVTTLYPTGRMTSDGWVEVGNDDVRIDGTRGATVALGFFSAGGSAIDAVEFVPEGPLEPQDRSGEACRGSADPVCASDEVCLFSQCRYVGGWVPPIPSDRDDVAAYLAARAELLFGPYINRTRDLPNTRLALDRMRETTNKHTYWNGFMLGVRRLHDGHTTTSSLADFILQNEKPLGLCFLEGDADLSHDVAPKDPFYLDVLVSHTGQDRTLGLVAGDRLVLVDGQHPVAWARAQIEHHWGLSPTSNHRTFAELAEQLRGLVARYAHTIAVVRCDAQAGTCGDLETIDLAAIAPIAPGEPFASVACDNRPLRHLADSPANHASASFDKVYFGLLTDSTPEEAIFGAEWESLYTTTGNDYVGGSLKAAVAAFKASAQGVVLDHRSGNGGTIVAPGILWSFAVPRRPVSVYVDRQRAEDEQPPQDEGFARFQRGLDANQADWAGSNQPTTLPVALLTTRDVSASDWLPLGLKGAAPNVKIFAPYETNGGFSTRYAFGYWLGMSYVIAVGDTYDAEGRTHNGRGVEPDVVVLPKQSELLVGIDSVHAAALAWVREELAQ
jgi:hypothetical protein